MTHPLLLGFLALCLQVPDDPQPQPEASPDERKRRSKIELLGLQGKWRIESQVENGQPVPAETLDEQTLTIGGDVFVLRQGEAVLRFGVLKLDPTRDPKRVDIRILGGEEQGTQFGIYERKGNTVRFCVDTDRSGRPENFDVKDKPNHLLLTIRRAKSTPARMELTGKYKTVAGALGSPDITGSAEIRRVGESYLVRYFHDDRLAYVGVGVRAKGVLSVCWTNGKETGLSVYRIEKGPKLIGHYAKLGGIGVLNKEELTLIPVID